MPETLEPKVKATLRAYVRDVKSLNNEANKTARFNALIGELFPGTAAVTEYPRGVEKVIRIDQATGTKRGRADAYYGNAIIEFEKSLDATLEEAKRQLCEYVAGTWQKEKRKSLRPLLAIASDGLRWISYRPVLPEGEEPTPEGIVLDELRDFTVTDENLGEFWLWLTSLLFRSQQVEPTAEQFQFEFGSLSFQYREGMAALKRAWGKVNSGSEARLAFETWQRYLTVTYGGLTESTTAVRDRETAQELSELETLFLRHTYLASIARLLIWAALSEGKNANNLRQVAKDVLSGRYFESKRLDNLVDDDFFHWIRNTEAETILAPMWERILSHLVEYDLSKIREDVLKGVYQQLIDPKDRHELGEYYTPDWLCERIVREILPTHGYHSVLDPSCGSGSFLRAAIHHFLKHNPDGTDNERLRLILRNVQGIDIHPVAVTISRATYVLALGKLISSARSSINIPIYLADSLFLPHEVEKNLYDKLSGVEISFGGKKSPKSVVISDMLIRSPELFDQAISACTTVAEEHADHKKDTKETLDKYLGVHVGELHTVLEYPDILASLWSFTESLASLIREKENSIWSFIIRNSYRPAMLKQHFDFIIGNPPWLSYRYISDPEYQEEIKKRAITTYAIAPTSQKLFTQMELATVFLAHSMATFAKPDARLGFVMPRSVLSADQHQNLIKRKYSPSAKFQLSGYWDLRDVEPLFKVPCCVLFARRSLSPGNPTDVLPVLEWSGKLPARDVNWLAAKAHVGSTEKEGRVIYLGSRAALSTELGASAEAKPSQYQKVFKNGATIYPRSFYFVQVQNLNGTPDADTQYWVETDRTLDSKPPYKQVKMSGFVEGRFFFSSAVSKHVLPFAVLSPATVVLPLTEKDGVLSMVSSDWLREKGYREFAGWVNTAEKLWLELREDKSEKMTLLEWLDYQGKLTAQDLRQEHLVLYNASGKNVAAAYFNRVEQGQLPFVVDHKLYWAAFSDPAEAHYVTAILNSQIANLAIKPFQSSGLLGERDVHKKLLEIPFPVFNSENKTHQSISILGASARKLAQEILRSGTFPERTTLARQRAFIRIHVKSELQQINALVAKLLK